MKLKVRLRLRARMTTLHSRVKKPPTETSEIYHSQKRRIFKNNVPQPIVIDVSSIKVSDKKQPIVAPTELPSVAKTVLATSEHTRAPERKASVHEKDLNESSKPPNPDVHAPVPEEGTASEAKETLVGATEEKKDTLDAAGQPKPTNTDVELESKIISPEPPSVHLISPSPAPVAPRPAVVNVVSMLVEPGKETVPEPQATALDNAAAAHTTADPDKSPEPKCVPTHIPALTSASNVAPVLGPKSESPERGVGADLGVPADDMSSINPTEHMTHELRCSAGMIKKPGGFNRMVPSSAAHPRTANAGKGPQVVASARNPANGSASSERQRNAVNKQPAIPHSMPSAVESTEEAEEVMCSKCNKMIPMSKIGTLI